MNEENVKRFLAELDKEGIDGWYGDECIPYYFRHKIELILRNWNEEGD